MAYVRNCFVVGSLGAALSLAAPARTQTQGEAAPTFEHGSSWPKPLPNNWVIGIVWGVDVGPNDHDEAYVATDTSTDGSPCMTPPRASTSGTGDGLASRQTTILSRTRRMPGVDLGRTAPFPVLRTA